MEYKRPLTDAVARNFSPLSLAFVGDGVFEKFVRERVILSHPNELPHKLHLLAVKYVKASSQSKIIESLEEYLSEDEMYIFKRGRNAKSNTTPKNANLLDYRKASGFEALIGYLYLTGRDERLEEIVKLSFRIIEKGDNHDEER